MATFDNTQSLSGQVGFGGNTAGPANEDPALEAFGGGRGNRATEGIIGDYALEQQGYTRPIRNTVTGQITNPYPDSFFSRMFGAENVDYTNILGDQMGNVENARRARFFNTGAVSKGFGSLFGGAEGEMTVAGPRVAQIQPATTSQSLAGILSMGLGIPGVGALSRAARTTYAPEGYLNKDFDSPSALSATSEALTGISPEAVGNMYDQAAGYVDQAKEGIRSFFTDNDVDGVINNLSPAPAGYEEVVGGADGAPLVLNPSSSRPEIGGFNNINRPDDMAEMSYDDILRGRDLMADQITPAGLPVSSPEPYEIQSSPMLDSAQSSQTLDQTTPSPDIRIAFPDDPQRQAVYEAMLNPDYQSGRHLIDMPNGNVLELIGGRFSGMRSQ